MPHIVQVVRKRLTDKLDIMFSNENGTQILRAMTLVLCNTTEVNQKIWLYIGNTPNINEGAIISGLILDPNESIVIPEKILMIGDIIRARGQTKDAVTFSTDIRVYE